MNKKKGEILFGDDFILFLAKHKQNHGGKSIQWGISAH